MQHAGKILIILGFGVIFGVIGLAVLGSLVGDRDPLVKVRKEHETELRTKGPSAGSYDNVVPEGVKVVHYQSDGRELLAWVLRPPGKEKKAAVLFAHGGDALGAGDVKSVMPFVNAGFIVMLPAWRGENGNPGYHEMCYGEVDDAAAALNYLTARKSVDSERLFAAGHSIGGTVVMLLAEYTDKLKKAAACGGYPNMSATGPYPGEPFKSTPKELELRSPLRFTKDLGCPLMLYYGGLDRGDMIFKRQADRMAKMARLGKNKQTVEVKVFQNADHFSALDSAIPEMVNYFSRP